jgi:dienelactone hydrolase
MRYTLAAALVLSVLLSGCASVTETSRENKGTSVPYQVNGKKFEGYFVSASPKAPLVLLVHDWDGLTGYEIKRADMLADLGYAVFAADLYGTGVRPTEIADKRRLTGELYDDRAKMRSYLQAALQAAQTQGGPVDNAVAMGYCFGGTAILELARAGTQLKGFVAFHGGLKIPANQDYAKTKGQVLILHGTADTNVTMDLFAKLADELEKHNIKHEMITYSQSPHAFSVFGSPRYREDADKKSWKRFTEFLTDTLVR